MKTRSLYISALFLLNSLISFAQSVPYLHDNIVASAARPGSSALAVQPVHPERDGQSGKPNVLFIAVDDLNDWIGALKGHPQVKTPNIDRLAAEGVLFTNAHTQSPLCNPSRTSLLTGLRPSTTGIYGLAPRIRQIEKTREVVTLPQYFSRNGYHTISTGKVLHGGITPGERETEFMEWGFDGSFGPVPEQKIVKAKLDMVDHPLLDWGVYPAESDTALGDYKIASWAVNRIDRLEKEPGDTPFFLAVGFRRPHVPLLVSQKWFDMYPKEDLIMPPAPLGDRDDVPDFAWYLHWFLPEPRLSWLIKNNEWENKVRAYLACISFVDAQIGKVVDKLRSSKFRDNTIVVLWSDHGYHLGEKDISGKNTLWERSTHVPLIVAGPGIAGGRQSHEAVELLDIYPTLVDLAGLEEKKGLEGESLVPLLNDVKAERAKPAITVHNPDNYSVRTERWRYIQYADGSQELYDHSRDPQEYANLAGNPDYRQVISELKEWLPDHSEPLAPGSSSRVLEKKADGWYWEGEKIEFENLVR